MANTLSLAPHEELKMLRNGEKVTCTRCKTGVMRALGNAKTTNTFQCDNCKNQIILYLK